MDPVLDVRLGAFPEVLDDVGSETAALVVADPPWNDLAAWSAVGPFSARVLKPGGVVLAYMGSRWCFEAMDLLSAHLDRVRLAFLPEPDDRSWDPAVNCHEAGSFMVIMAKGAFSPSGPWSNMVEGVVEGQRWHRYQRPLANVRHYVEAFTEPGDLVVDPFLGSGSTAVACAQTGRSFVGCDVLLKNFSAAVTRLDMLQGGTGAVGVTPADAAAQPIPGRPPDD